MSASPNVGAWGVAYYLNVNYNLTAATVLTLTITWPDGSTFTRTGPDVTAPNVDYVTADGNGTFLAGQYSKYAFKAGDLTVPGTYTARLTYDDGTKHIPSDVDSFVVNA